MIADGIATKKVSNEKIIAANWDWPLTNKWCPQTKNEIIAKVQSNKKIIGVGESGLDFYYNNSNKENQILCIWVK